MPSYTSYPLLNRKMHDCDQQFDRLFFGLDKSSAFQEQLSQTKSYYRRLFTAATNKYDGTDALEEYENLVTLLEQIKAGNVTTKEALKTLDNMKTDRKTMVVLENIGKVCEVLFWAAVATVSYISCLTIGIPMIGCNPLLGLVTTFGTLAAALLSIEVCCECFDEFKSFTPANEQYKREINAAAFFQPAIAVTQYRQSMNLDSSSNDSSSSEEDSSSEDYSSSSEFAC